MRMIKFGLVAMLAGAWAISLAVYVHSRGLGAGLFDFSLPSSGESRANASLPKSAEPLYEQAYEAFRRSPPDYDQAAALVESAISQRYLFPLAWELRSDIAFRQGNRDAALEFADRAQSLWPNHAWWLWRVAMLRMRIEDNAGSLKVLKRYLEVYPSDTYRAIAVARRFDYAPDILLQQLVPEDSFESREAFLGKAMRVAQGSQNVEFALAVWNQLSADQRASREFADKLFWVLRQNKEWDLTKKTWNELKRPALAVYNGEFESDLLNYGLGWRVKNVRGAKVSRDVDVGYKDNTSLQVIFDGSTNMTYASAYQNIPLKKNTRYRLDCFWRAENISTRSGVFVDVIRVGDKYKLFGKAESRFGSWDWTPVSLEFETDDKTEFARFRIRRNKTSALDNLISGKVWIDDVRLTPLEETQTTADSGNG